MMSRVQFTPEHVVIDGKTVQLISGAIHYFRVPSEMWRDRLEKALRCGLNAVETYMPWNLHEPKPGEFHFEDMLDFERFIRLAGELGLYVIVRPGPYICAEWDNGGLPVWLTAQEGLELRRSNDKYLSAVEGYLTKILPMLAKLQLDQDGPVVALQIENEYG
ncbi:MAG: beta-galactosidase, partial [Victivallales bacterium]|nr:beta-galactosidase [Victivallales bacterium]